MSFYNHIDFNRLPNHIAIIMDGNGRWAKEKGKLRVFGHKEGVKSVRDVVEAATDIGIKNLTLYTFSTENWNRPAFEVAALMELLVTTLASETERFMTNGVRLNVIGDLNSIPDRSRNALLQSMQKTKNNTKLTLHIALSYSGRWELEQTIKTIVQKCQNNEISASEINSKLISDLLCTSGIPDPELLIRTGGEYRVSNFLLWQIAYSELYFTDVYWPDFRKENFYKAIVDFQSRERRFGKTSEQL